MRAALSVVVGALSFVVFFQLAHEPAPVVDEPRVAAWDRRIDLHTHIHPAMYATVLKLFDRYGTRTAVNLSSNPDPVFLSQIEAHSKKVADGRVLHFAGVDWRLLAEPETFGQKAADVVTACVEAGARGIKIPKALGLSLRWPDGSLVAIDDARLDPVFERASELGVPVAIHVADPVAFWSPIDEHNERRAELELNPQWSFAGPEFPSHRALLDAAERRYARHPKLRFIAVHVAGNPEDLSYVERLLRDNANVFVDIAARVPELGRAPAERGRRFFVEHQDRIVFGTDLGLGPRSIMLGAPLKDPETPADVDNFFAATRRYLETNDEGFAHPTPIQGDWTINGVGLPKPVLEKLYVTNAERLLTRTAQPRAQGPAPSP